MDSYSTHQNGQMYVDAGFWAGPSRDLDFFVAASVCWHKLIFFKINFQNFFLQNQQISNISSARVGTTNPGIDS